MYGTGLPPLSPSIYTRIYSDRVSIPGVPISRAPAFQPDSLTFDNKIETILILQLLQK